MCRCTAIVLINKDDEKKHYLRLSLNQICGIQNFHFISRWSPHTQIIPSLHPIQSRCLCNTFFEEEYWRWRGRGCWINHAVCLERGSALAFTLKWGQMPGNESESVMAIVTGRPPLIPDIYIVDTRSFSLFALSNKTTLFFLPVMEQ